MSDAVGLTLFFFITMIIPVSLIVYLKWDKITIWYEAKVRKIDHNGNEIDKSNKENFFKKLFSTYFGKGDRTPVSVEDSINMLTEKDENLSAQDLLSKQRELEEKNKLIESQSNKKIEKKKLKEDERQKLKEFKEIEKQKEKEFKNKKKEDKKNNKDKK